jgi:probable F420-dependent oxidoreductase
MRFGIGTPIVTLVPGVHAEWEDRAGLPELTQIATTADRLGYLFMTTGDHVAVPGGLPRGQSFWDPLVTFSYFAALTERIRFLPFVLVLPFYHPLEITKRFGMLDMVSGGRLLLGVGVGNLEEEFDVLGLPFADRGPRADDALRAIRASWGHSPVDYAGFYYEFHGLVVEPGPVQEHVPIWVGGHTRRSLRRAVELGDGWAPPPVRHNGPRPSEIKPMLDAAGAPDGFDVVVMAEASLDPISQPGPVAEVVAQLGAIGGTVMNVRFVHRSLAHYLEQLEAFATVVDLPAQSSSAPASAPAS